MRQATDAVFQESLITFYTVREDFGEKFYQHARASKDVFRSELTKDSFASINGKDESSFVLMDY